ncbi:MAG: four helix bundle protein [Chitinophagaceae bacterium]|nr:four helix bundle protein [Chitinophagaceae bacterium]
MKPHQRLDAWKKGIEFTIRIYAVTEEFPKHEVFGLTAQLRRASVSIPNNIAEGAGRNTSKEFLHFLFISRGSLSEVDTLLIIARRLKYISIERYDELNRLLDFISKLLSGLINSVRTKL